MESHHCGSDDKRDFYFPLRGRFWSSVEDRPVVTPTIWTVVSLREESRTRYAGDGQATGSTWTYYADCANEERRRSFRVACDIRSRIKLASLPIKAGDRFYFNNPTGEYVEGEIEGDFALDERRFCFRGTDTLIWVTMLQSAVLVGEP